MKNQSVQKGFAILSTSGIIIKIISLLYIPLLLSIIGETGNGFYQAAAQIFAFAYVLTNSGTLNAITKMTSEYIAKGENADGQTDAFRAFRVSRMVLGIIGGVISLLLIIFAQPIANAVKFPEISLSIILIAPSAFITALVSSYRGYYQGQNNFKPRAVSQVLEQVVNLVASITLALLAVAIFGNKPDGILLACAGANAGTTLAALAALVYLIWFNKKSTSNTANNESPAKLTRKTFETTLNIWKVEKNEKYQTLKTFFKYSIPITLSAGLQYAGSVVDMWNTKSRLLVAGFSPDMATQMYGYLAKYQQLIYVPLIIIIGLASTILPNLSGANAIDDKQKFRSSLSYAYRWCFIISIPAAVLMAVLSSQVYQSIKLGLGSELLLIGSVVTILMSVTQVQSSVLQGLSKMYLLAIFLLIGIIVKIIVNYWLIAIPFFNVNGAIIGSIICYLIPIFLNEMYIRRQLRKKLGKPLKMLPFLYKPFSSSVAMGIVVFFANFLFNYMTRSIFGATGIGGYITVVLSLILSLVTGAVTFFAAMLYFKGFKKIDLDMVPQRLKRFIPLRVQNSLK